MSENVLMCVSYFDVFPAVHHQNVGNQVEYGLPTYMLLVYDTVVASCNVVVVRM